MAVLGPIVAWINCAGNGVYGRLEDCLGGIPTGDRRDLPRHGQWHAGCALPYAQAGARRHCECLFCHRISRFASDVVLRRSKAAVRAFGQVIHGELRLERSAVRISTVFPPAVNTPFFSHALSHMGWPARPARPVYQPEVVALGIWQAMASGRAEMTITVRWRLSRWRRGSRRVDGLVCRTNGVRATVDPRARGLRSPGDDLVRTLAARVHRARAVRTTGTRMERTALVRRGAERGRKPAGEGMARRYVKRSVACQTRSRVPDPKLGLAARPDDFEIDATDRSEFGRQRGMQWRVCSLFFRQRCQRQTSPDETDQSAGSHQSSGYKPRMYDVRDDARSPQAIRQPEGRHHQGKLRLAVGAPHCPAATQHKGVGSICARSEVDEPILIIRDGAPATNKGSSTWVSTKGQRRLVARTRSCPSAVAIRRDRRPRRC